MSILSSNFVLHLQLMQQDNITWLKQQVNWIVFSSIPMLENKKKTANTCFYIDNFYEKFRMEWWHLCLEPRKPLIVIFAIEHVTASYSRWWSTPKTLPKYPDVCISQLLLPFRLLVFCPSIRPSHAVCIDDYLDLDSQRESSTIRTTVCQRNKYMIKNPDSS